MPVIFGNAPADCGCRRCLPPAPEFEECCTPCCGPCDPCGTSRCRPKTHAKDAIRIERGEVERIIELSDVKCPSDNPAPAVRRCVEMVLRKKGSPCELMRIEPYRAVDGGGMVFRWGHHFKALPSGYYEGDIIINGCHEFGTILFYIPPYKGQVTSNEYVNGEHYHHHHCGCGCNPCQCGSCSPLMHDELVDEIVYEGSCDAKCK